MSLERFIEAQAPLMPAVLEELRTGRKTTHWMWFVFPQLRGLGRSPMAHRYGIADRAEAEAYLSHPLLGPRLTECTELVLASGRTAHQVFGDPDTMKLRSCLTLFEAAGGSPVFSQALQRLFGGERCPASLRLLESSTLTTP